MTAESQSEPAKIPWRPVQAQRHVLAQEYGELKHERVSLVATKHFPKLVQKLESLVPPPPDAGDAGNELPGRV